MTSRWPTAYLGDFWSLLPILVPVAAASLRGCRNLRQWLQDRSSRVDRAFFTGFMALAWFGYPHLELGFVGAAVSTLLVSTVVTSAYVACARPTRTVAFPLFGVVSAVDAVALAAVDLGVAVGMGKLAFRGVLLTVTVGFGAVAVWAVSWFRPHRADPSGRT